MNKKIELSKLSLRNFKGISNFRLDINSGDADVYGDNAVGKTTLFDAFTWLLFDKDSQNKKDFDIKTLDASGKALSGLEHEVEGILLIQGKKKTLRKVYTEKWTKKRGSATSEFTGHETAYYIDEVPMKKSEYADFVDGVINEEIFKMLTNPAYFNEVLDMKKRRKILLEVCGDVSNEEVITGSAALAKLPAILGDRSIEDHRKMIAAKRTDINKELEKIPVRIDEAERSKPDVSGLNEEQLLLKLDTCKSQIGEKEAELTRIQTGGEISVKENRMREIDGELLQIKNNLQSDSIDKISDKRQSASRIQGQIDDNTSKIMRSERQIAANQQMILDNEKQAAQLRQRWSAINEEVLEQQHNHGGSEDCPTCGQSIPFEQVNAAFQKAVADLNRTKSERLSDIQTKGKALVAENARFEQGNADLTNRLRPLKQETELLSAELNSVNKALKEIKEGIQDVTSNPTYISKTHEKTAIEQEILNLRSSVQSKVEQVRSELTKLRMDAGSLEQSKAKHAQVGTINQRIADLKNQEKSLASEYERLESELYLTEEFIRTKVSMLESKINSKFQHVQFKLFEQQINGGLEEKCETMVGGVPYSTGLNRAAQMNGGLDIINTLSEHYGIVAPIFIDNAEAVTQLIETNGQQIRLIVSAADKHLRVETKLIQEAI